MRRRIAALGISVLAGAGMAVAGGAPAAASHGADTTRSASSLISAAPLRQAIQRGRWVRVAEFDTRRQCERAGRRIDERRRDIVRYRCIRDWDRDWGRGD